MSFEARDADIGPGAFWRTLGARPIGATVITAMGKGGPEGFLGLSFAHVSAKPPTVLVSVGSTTSALGAIRASGAFAANLLAPDAEALARAFGGEAPKETRFEGVETAPFVSGAPVLADAVAVFDCTVLREYEEEGTSILLGRVVGVRSAETGGALLAHQGQYRPFP